MPTSCFALETGSVPGPVAQPRRPSAAQANEALRSFVRAREDRLWTQLDLAELDRLRQVWEDAVRAGMTTAA